MAELEQKIMLRQSKMEEIRDDYENGLWIDIARFVNPRRENITDDSRFDEKGQRRGKDSYDGTALGALNTWADGMQGFLVSGAWFRSEMDNPELNRIDSVREWLQIYDRKMYSAFERSNFYAVLAEWFRDAGSIGTATLFTQEELGTGRISHLSIHPREIWIAENNFGEVDTVHRKFFLTARAAEQEFGDKVSQTIKDNLTTDPDKEHEFIHAVFPNTDRLVPSKRSEDKPFRSIYLETKATGSNETNTQSDNTVNIVRDSGFDVNPYAVWRFRKNSDEIYGYSPAADGLVETFGLNQFAKTRMMFAQKSVEPALNVPEEMRDQVRNMPNGYNYFEKPDRVISPISLGGNYPISVQETEALQKSLEDKYRVEFFRAFIGRQGEATAEEIRAIKGEQAGLMSAQTDRLYIEGLRKIFDIVSDIEDKRGSFLPENGMPPMPREIIESGGRINFLLTGPLAQAQRRILELDPALRTLEALGGAAEVLGPEVLDVINKDETAEFIAESGNIPQRLLNDKDTREQIRADRAARIAEKERQLALVEAAKAAPGVSGPVDENSILANVQEAVSA
jgi:hypothetical protein